MTERDVCPCCGAEQTFWADEHKEWECGRWFLRDPDGSEQSGVCPAAERLLFEARRQLAARDALDERFPPMRSDVHAALMLAVERERDEARKEKARLTVDLNIAKQAAQAATYDYGVARACADEYHRERDTARAQVEALTKERDTARDGASAAMKTAGDVLAQIIVQRDDARAETARYAALIQGPLAVEAQDLRKALDATLGHLRAVVASHDCRHDGTPRDRMEDCPSCAARDAAAAFLAAKEE